MFRKAWEWVKDKWNRFDAWAASMAPGVKTKIVAALGALGNFAYVAQQYVAGLPLEKFFTATNLLVLNAVLFTLAFWFRGMSERHE